MQTCFPVPKSGIDLPLACVSLAPGMSNMLSEKQRRGIELKQKTNGCPEEDAAPEVHVQHHSPVRQWGSHDWADEDMSAQS